MLCVSVLRVHIILSGGLFTPHIYFVSSGVTRVNVTRGGN